MNKYQFSTQFFFTTIILTLLLQIGTRPASTPVGNGAPIINDMLPHRYEMFTMNGNNILITLEGYFTHDTKVVINVYGNNQVMDVPPTSLPTARLITTTVLLNNGLQVMVPLSQWSHVYGPNKQTLSAIVASNSSGTGVYYFSVVGPGDLPNYYHGGLP